MALGRGLGALISSAPKQKSEDTNDQERIWYIPLTSIAPNAHQPRKTFGQQELEDLASSVKEHGILQPLLVTEKTDGGYELVAGERRLRAAKLAGLAVVPAIVKKMADRQKLEVAIIENVQRENLNPLEEAFAYKRLMEEFNLTQQDVSDKVGKSRPAVANILRLLDLPEEVKTALVEQKINTSQARALLSLEERGQQLDMLSSMLGHKITVRDLEKNISKQSGGPKRRDPNLAFLEDKLRGALGTKISISQKGDKGTISISYYSKEELNQIIEKLSE